MWVRGLLLAIALPLALAGCSYPPSVNSSEEFIQAKRFAHSGPTSLTLYTIVSNTSGSGAHSGLAISGSERILFDPAGSFAHPQIAERGDVVFGFSPALRQSYIDYHSRITFYTVEQTIEVSPEVAEMALRRAYEYGAVPHAMCANSITDILEDLPGFEGIKRTYYPGKLMDNFAQLSGVTTRTYRDDDPDVHVVKLR